jgi:hypothetical protein
MGDNAHYGAFTNAFTNGKRRVAEMSARRCHYDRK